MGTSRSLSEEEVGISEVWPGTLVRNASGEPPGGCQVGGIARAEKRDGRMME